MKIFFVECEYDIGMNKGRKGSFTSEEEAITFVNVALRGAGMEDETWDTLHKSGLIYGEWIGSN